MPLIQAVLDSVACYTFMSVCLSVSMSACTWWVWRSRRVPSDYQITTNYSDRCTTTPTLPAEMTMTMMISTRTDRQTDRVTSISSTCNTQYVYTLCLKKSMWRYLFEHNSNINCPIIIIFGTVVTETISYWTGISFFHLTYFVQHHYLGNHTTWKFANSAINYIWLTFKQHVSYTRVLSIQQKIISTAPT